MADQKADMKVTIEEEPLRQKSPVHSPLEQKLPSKVKCQRKITNWIIQEEGKTEY